MKVFAENEIEQKLDFKNAVVRLLRAEYDIALTTTLYMNTPFDLRPAANIALFTSSAQ